MSILNFNLFNVKLIFLRHKKINFKYLKMSHYECFLDKCFELLRLQGKVFIGVCLLVKINMLAIKCLKSTVATV